MKNPIQVKGIESLDEIDLTTIVSEINWLTNLWKRQTTIDDFQEKESNNNSIELTQEIWESEMEKENDIEYEDIRIFSHISIWNFIAMILLRKKEILNWLKWKLSILSWNEEIEGIEEIWNKEFFNYLIVYLRWLNKVNENWEIIWKLIDLNDIDKLIDLYNTFSISKNRDLYRKKVGDNISPKNQKIIWENSLNQIENDLSHPRQSEFIARYLNTYPEKKSEVIDIIKFSIDCPIVLNLIERRVSIEKLSKLIKEGFDFYILTELVNSWLSLDKTVNLINTVEITDLNKIINKDVNKEVLKNFINLINSDALSIFIKRFDNKTIREFLYSKTMLKAVVLFNMYEENKIFDLFKTSIKNNSFWNFKKHLLYYFSNESFNVVDFNDFLINSWFRSDTLISFICNSNYQKEKVIIVFSKLESRKFWEFLILPRIGEDTKATLLNHYPEKMSELLEKSIIDNLRILLLKMDENVFWARFGDDSISIDNLTDFINLKDSSGEWIYKMLNDKNFSNSDINFALNQNMKNLSNILWNVWIKDLNKQEISRFLWILNIEWITSDYARIIIKEDKEWKIMRLINEWHLLDVACEIWKELDLKEFEIGQLREISRAVSWSKRWDILKVEALNKEQIDILFNLHWDSNNLTGLSHVDQQRVVYTYEMIENEEDELKQWIYKEELHELLEKSDISFLNENEIFNIISIIEENKITRSSWEILINDSVFKRCLYQLVEKGDLRLLNKEDIKTLVILLQWGDIAIDKKYLFELLHSTNVSWLNREDIKTVVQLLKEWDINRHRLFSLVKWWNVSWLNEADIKTLVSMLDCNSNVIHIDKETHIAINDTDLYKLTNSTRVTWLTKDDIIDLLCLIKNDDKKRNDDNKIDFPLQSKNLTEEEELAKPINEEVLYELINNSNISWFSEENIRMLVWLIEDIKNHGKEEIVYKILKNLTPDLIYSKDVFQFIIDFTELDFNISIANSLADNFGVYINIVKSWFDLKKLFKIINWPYVKPEDINYKSDKRKKIKSVSQIMGAFKTLVYDCEWDTLVRIIEQDYEKFVFKLKWSSIKKIKKSINENNTLPDMPIYWDWFRKEKKS